MDETPRRFGVKQAVGVAVIFLGCVAVISVVVGQIATFLGGSFITPVRSQLLGLGVAMVLGACVVLWRERSLSRVKLVGREFLVPKGTLVPLLITILGFGQVLSEIDNLLRAFWPMPDFLRQLVVQMLDVRNHPWLVVAAAVVAGPIAEELVFRGVILKGSLTTLGERRAIMVSAVVFALSHFNPWQLLPTFLVGLVLGWVYVRTRSLGLCCAAHMMNNAMAALAVLLADRIPGIADTGQSDAAGSQPLWLTLSGVVLLVGGGIWLRRKMAGEEERQRTGDMLAPG